MKVNFVNIFVEAGADMFFVVYSYFSVLWCEKTTFTFAESQVNSIAKGIVTS